MTGSIHEVTAATGKAAEAFRQAIEDTRRRSPSSFDQWFSGVQLDGIDDHVLTLAARDEFVRDWVREHFLPDLLDTLLNPASLTTAKSKPELRDDLESLLVRVSRYDAQLDAARYG